MMKTEFILIDMDYIDDKNGKTWIRLFGKNKKGEHCCFFDTCKAFFYLIPKPKTDLKKYSEKIKKIKIQIARRVASVEKIEIVNKNFVGKQVKALKVYVENHKDINSIKEVINSFKETEEKLETDISFVTRYILEKNVKPLQWHSIEFEELGDNWFKENRLRQVDTRIIGKIKKINSYEEKSDKQEQGKQGKQLNFEPKILAFDIETSEFEADKGEILMISLADGKIKKVITWKHFDNPPEEVEFVQNEKAMIERFKEIVKKEKPDCLVGYFSDGFDLPYLRQRADALGVRLDLGLDKSNVSFIRGRITSAKMPGIVHIDLFKFVNNIISPSLQSETLTLNEVANELVGEKKLKFDLREINKQLNSHNGNLKSSEWRHFCLYNLQDSILTAKLFGKLWPNIAELTRLTSEPLWVVSRATYSNLVEHHIIHNIRPFNEIIKHRPIRDEIIERRKHSYKAASVLQPKFGLYNKIAVFDFRSFWPNIIVSFNISPSTILEKKEKDSYEIEAEIDNKKKKIYFSKTKKGFIPIILKKILERRKKVKEKLKEHRTPILEARDYGLKTLANATYGYYGFFGARWYCIECSASITALGRFYIKKVMDQISKAGYNVLYSDTDSIMFELGNKTEKQARKFLKEINDSLPGTMELDLEDFYKRGIFVAKRTVREGAKKKYALLKNDGTLKIRGFETVRRDWAKLTKEMQDKVLKMILEEGKADKALKYVQEIIAQLKKKEINKDKLIIKTQLKKELGTYANVTPHVIIARRMQKLGLPVSAGTIIEYIVAEKSSQGKQKNKNKSLVRERAKLPDECKEKEYDSNYYIEHQIIPAVENIFDVFNIKKEDILGKEQKKLEEF